MGSSHDYSSTSHLHHHQGAATTNISKNEQWASLWGGGALVLYGLTRRFPLGALIALAGGYLSYRGLTGHCALYETMGVNTSDQPEQASHDKVTVEACVTVDESAETLYGFWRNPANLARFMKHVEAITVNANGEAEWCITVPLGTTLKWKTQVTEDVPNRRLVWHSLPGGHLNHMGSVSFRPASGGRGTEVEMAFAYDPPGGAIAEAFAQLFNDVTTQKIKDDLRRFKQFVEAGEIASTEGQASGQEEAKAPPAKSNPRTPAEDMVEEASRESFPASDSPGWTTVSSGETVNASGDSAGETQS